jgi:hypothetical protein
MYLSGQDLRRLTFYILDKGSKQVRDVVLVGEKGIRADNEQY